LCVFEIQNSDYRASHVRPPVSPVENGECECVCHIVFFVCMCIYM